MRRCFEVGTGGVVSLEPQPFLQCHEAAPKTQWVMVAARWYRSSDWLEGLRLLWGRFEGKGAVGGGESISGCGLARDHTPRPGLKQPLVAARGLH
jgi:hypothetical protein